MPKALEATNDQVAIGELFQHRHSKWTLVVILTLRRETRRFGELHKTITGISQKALTASLRHLEREGLISRTSYPTIPPRVEYALTHLGVEALRVFEALEQFNRQHWAAVLEARRAFDLANGGPEAADHLSLS